MTHTLYFKEAGPGNTPQVINAVREYLSVYPIHHVIVATTRGETGVAVAEAFKDRSVIVVTHQAGFIAPNTVELTADNQERILKTGAKILTATHAFAGVSRGIRKALGTWTIAELLAVAFRTFGQGTKVCAEIAMMAADAGLVPVDQDVICIAGTGTGADTAWVVRPAYTSSFTELKMKCCICKPLEF